MLRSAAGKEMGDANGTAPDGSVIGECFRACANPAMPVWATGLFERPLVQVVGSQHPVGIAARSTQLRSLTAHPLNPLNGNVSRTAD